MNENGNTGHGHVFPRPDGMKARCGGPMMCNQCALDFARLIEPPKPVALDPSKEQWR